MSQITRCPACATQFKVVADQLRISEGWVRCGQCKEVFDASEHLVAAPPPPMLPDVSLTDTRPPPTLAPRVPETRGAWGVLDAPAHRPADPVRVAPAPSSLPVPAATPYPPAPPSVVGNAGMAASDAFHIPAPTVPAFLSAGAPVVGHGVNELRLEPLPTFGWRPPPQSAPAVAPAPAPPIPAVVSPGPSAPAVPAAPAVRQESLVLPGLAASLLVVDRPPVERSTLAQGIDPASLGIAVPDGYELPVADFSDSQGNGGPDTEIMPFGDGSLEDAYPPLDLPSRSSRSGALADDDEDHDDGEPLFGPSAAALPPPLPRVLPDAPAAEPVADGPAITELAPVPARDSGFRESQAPLPEVDFELVHDAAFPATPSPAPASRRDASAPRKAPKPKLGRDGNAPVDDDDAQAADPDPDAEVSFVRAARRKAFWRRPAVRATLGLVMLLLLCVLAVQVAVQERNRIAAMDSRARPWLQQLCVHLGCTLAPQRQIADVVIDSSSFNKARGDSYQLALTVKSRAAIPLEMPAVELTLTDAQDQPVLRRVLMPADLAAPVELAARGEWSASVAVVVTSGGARVSGYRLLAFYP